MRRSLTPLLLAFALAASSCGDGGDAPDTATDDENQPDPPERIPNEAPAPVQTALNCPKGTHLNYENFGEAFLLNYCTSCHSKHLPAARRAGAPLAANFDTASDASVWRAVILKKAVTEMSMPPSANMPPLDRALLAEWLNCGAPSGSDRIE